MNAFSKSANVPFDVIDAKICSVMLMDDKSGVGQLRSISWMTGSLKTCTHHLALAGDHQFKVSLITSACTEFMMVTDLKKKSTPFHSVSKFAKLRLLFDAIETFACSWLLRTLKFVSPFLLSGCSSSFLL